MSRSSSRPRRRWRNRLRDATARRAAFRTARCSAGEVATDTGISDKTFGFADLGLAVDVPLKFVPARYGKWTFSGGPHFLWLGQNSRLLAGPSSGNALNGLNVTGGKGFEVWAVAGVKIEY